MNAEPQFVDAGYFIAFVNVRDDLHTRAIRIASGLKRAQVTTELVLIEVGDAFASQQWRGLARQLLASVQSNPNIEVVPLTSSLFARGLELFNARPDKDWGLTDCISFIVMQDRGIREALAHDHHFVRAGFRALLRE